MPNERLHQFTERLSSLFRSELRAQATAGGLKLIQLEALIYLGMANKYSDTLLAMTDYFGVTKGTMSQSLKALVGRGLVEKVPDENDGRVTHCLLTDTGKELVQAAYPLSSFSGLSPEESLAAEKGLEQVLRALQKSRQFRSFGLCRSCRFFEEREDQRTFCGLTKEPLSKSDAAKICREHECPQ